MMDVFDLRQEQVFDPVTHVEKILDVVGDGDFTVACWEPGQISPYHCHPRATEAYFCHSGGGLMRTPEQTSAITPGSFVVHPPGELHEYENGTERTLLFRVRYGPELGSRTVAWRGNKTWEPSADDHEYMRTHPEEVEDARTRSVQER